MEGEKRVEIGLSEGVAVEREERLAEVPRREADRAARAERLVLDLVVECELAVGAPEMVANLGRQIPARDDRAANTVPAQMLEGVGEERPVDEREHVLRASAR